MYGERGETVDGRHSREERGGEAEGGTVVEHTGPAVAGVLPCASQRCSRFKPATA